MEKISILTTQGASSKGINSSVENHSETLPAHFQRSGPQVNGGSCAAFVTETDALPTFGTSFVDFAVGISCDIGPSPS